MNEQNDNQKDVYAHFGLTAYHAQCLEMEIKNVFLLCVRANNRAMPMDIFKQCETVLDKQTLGILVRDIRKIVDFSDECVFVLKKALNNRNKLMHGFFECHAQNHLSHNGRNTMIRELEEYTDSFIVADTVMSSVSKAICKVLGITDEILNAEFEKFKKDAKQADSTEN